VNFDFNAWKARFLVEVDRVSYGRAAWKRLVDSGCDPNVLSWCLCYGCAFKGAPGFEMIAELRRGAMQKAKAAESLARRLGHDANEAPRLLAGESGRALQASMAAAVKELREQARTARRETSPKYNRPSEWLVYLVIHVEEQMGTPNYGDISTLADLAYATFDADPTKGTSVDAIRKLVERFKARHPELVLPNGRFDFEKIHRNLLYIVLALIGIAFLKSLSKPDVNSPSEISPSRPDDSPQQS